jgi:hypothetical protein
MGPAGGDAPGTYRKAGCGASLFLIVLRKNWISLAWRSPRTGSTDASYAVIPLFGLIRYFAPVARLPYTLIASSRSASESETSSV